MEEPFEGQILHLDPSARPQERRHVPHVARPVGDAEQEQTAEDEVGGSVGEAGVVVEELADVAEDVVHVRGLRARGHGGQIDAVDFGVGVGGPELACDDAGAAADVDERLGGL